MLGIFLVFFFACFCLVSLVAGWRHAASQARIHAVALDLVRARRVPPARFTR